MNFKAIYVSATIGTAMTILGLVNIPEASAQWRNRNFNQPANPFQSIPRPASPPSNPSTPKNTVTGTAASSVGAGAFGATPAYSANAEGQATGSNVYNNSQVELNKTPGGANVPAPQIQLLGTKATQTSKAGGVTGTGSSESTITAKTGQVTLSNTTQGQVTGAKSATVTGKSSASLNSGTSTVPPSGSASGEVNFSGSD